jgi:hypothetical protein
MGQAAHPLAAPFHPAMARQTIRLCFSFPRISAAAMAHPKAGVSPNHVHSLTKYQN